MTLKKLKVAPGIRNENSDLGLEGAWKDGNRVRFYKGSPEKIGGWQKATTADERQQQQVLCTASSHTVMVARYQILVRRTESELSWPALE